MKIDKIADEIAKKLQDKIGQMPEGFFDTFNFTQTGKNLTHPYAWGLLTQILWEFAGAKNVGIDVRFNSGNGIKFQPDLVLFDSDGEIIICVDYESPNSSDARIPTKDIDRFISWRPTKPTALYVIVTTLPDFESPRWELRYSSNGGYNYLFHGDREKIRKNPCEFWYKYYTKECKDRNMDGIALLNISGKNVQRLIPRKV